jgi:putative chitinase
VLPEIVPDNGANQKLLKIDSEVFENLMYNIPFQVSLDPQVCLVNGLDEEVGTKKYYNQLRRWKHPNKPGAAFIMNIYIHHQFIDNCLNENLDEKGNLSIFNFLNSICVGLNKALGGVNGLETIIDAEEATIRIIDTHYYEKQPRKYGLELYGYNTNNNPSTNKPYNTSNFVRNFNLKTEITPEFASMASISSTAGGYVKGVENTMFSKWCWGLTDRLQPEVSAPISTGYSSSRDEVKETYLRKFWWAHNSAFGMKDSAIELDPQIIENNVAIVSEFYKSIQSEIQIRYSGSYASPTNGFIPISLGVTMDGIGGIKIYNELNVATRFLPQNYPDNLHFIIKGVNHKLSNSDWETSVETVVIANGDGENQKQIPYEELRSEVLKILGETNKEISIANASSITPQGKVPDSARYIIEKILSVAKYDYGITDKERLTAILAVAGGETQYGVRQFESFNYNLDGARSAFSKIRSLPTQQSLQYIPVNRGGSGSQQKLANLLYGGMYGNNNNGDGWKYRGRGLSQVTFKSNYENIQSQLVSKKFRHLGNILTTPDLVATYEDLNVCILVEGKIKGWFGKRLIPNSPKYLTDAIAIQQLQNGGTYAYNPNTTPNYAKALAAINNTPWVQSLINQ